MIQPYPKTAAGRAGRAALFLTMAAADQRLLESPYFAELIREGRTVRLLARRVRASPDLAELAVRFSDWLPEAVVAMARATLASGPQKVPLFPAEPEDGAGLKAA